LIAAGCADVRTRTGEKMTHQLIERNTNYDFLRFVGISCIILAHMGVPGIVFQTRNFDVPLMVLLSGVSFSQYSSVKYKYYKKYLYSRFLRLILPTWLCLIIYNLVNVLGGNEIPGVQNIVLQFALIGGADTGIGIWIIRIFFLMAIAAPFLYFLNNNINNNWKFYLIMTAAYILYEVALSYSNLIFSDQFEKIINILVFFTVPYCFIFIYGLRINTFDKFSLKSHILISGIIFAVFCAKLYYENNRFIQTQQFKYPPQIYYLSFSLFISISLYYMLKFKSLVIDKLKPVQFIGRSTLWIYLWHWFMIKLYNYFNLNLYFIFKFILIYSAAVVFVYLQTKLLLFVRDNSLLNKKQSAFFIKIFTG